MKKLSHFLLIILGIPFLKGCESTQYDDIKNLAVVSIDLEKAQTLPFDSVFQVDELITLLGSENLPIKKIKRLEKQGLQYWVLTSDFILITDLNGNMIRQIADKGEGPGEFQSLDDIRWNETSQAMEILDRTSGKLLSYNISGDFQKEWKNKFLYTSLSFYPMGKDYLIYGGAFFDGEGHRLINVSRESGEKTIGYLPIEKEKNFLNVINNDVFFDNQTTLELFFSDRDTIYSISNDMVSPSVIFNPGANKVPNELYQSDFTSIMEYLEELKKNNYITLFTIQPTLNYYYLRFRQQSNFYPSILQKSSGKFKLIKAWDSGFGAEFSELSSYFIFAPIASDEEHLYFSLDPYAVKTAIDNLKDHPKLSEFLTAYPRIQEVYNQFPTYENPYILKLSIREF